MKPSLLRLLFILLSIAPALAVMTGAGCKSTAARIAYNTVELPQTTLEQALAGWDGYVQQFHPPLAQELAVRDAVRRYQVAALAAVDAAQVFAIAAVSGSTNSVAARVANAAASQSAANALAEVLALIRQFTGAP